MVVEIFISQTQAIDPLRHQVFHWVLDGFRVPIIREASGELLENSCPLLHFPQHQAAAIRRDIAAVKMSHHFSTAQCVKFNWFRFTLCHQKGRLCFEYFGLSQSQNAMRGGLFWSTYFANTI